MLWRESPLGVQRGVESAPKLASSNDLFVPAYGSGSSLSRSSSLARSSAQVFSSHRDSDSRLSQRGYLIKPTVNLNKKVFRARENVKRVPKAKAWRGVRLLGHEHIRFP